jgi:Tol biopolymer transport system component
VVFAISAPEGHILLPAAVPSPDGRLIAFVARDPSGPSALWIRSLASKTVQRLPDTEGAVEPFWSPDSGSIAFFAHGKLRRVAVSGGPAQNICNAVSGIGGTWNRSGDIVFAAGNRTPLYRVSAAGGKTEAVTTLDAARQENSHRWPYFLPDGRHFFFTARSNGPENTAVYVGSLDSKTTKRLLNVQSNALYTDAGFLLFGRDGTLMAQPFDRKKLELSGEPLPIGRVQHNSPSAKAMAGVSSNGSVITFYDATQNYAELRWYDRSGAELKLARPRGMFSNPRFSPDGKQVALSVTDPESGYRDIWTLDPVTGGMTRVTFHPANDWYAVWMRDGRELIFASDRLGHSSIFRKKTDGTGEEQLILPPAENGLFPNDVSPDATAFIYQQLDSTGRIDLWLYRLDGQASTHRWRVSQSRDHDASFSPDGSHIAYSSDESGSSEIYVSSIEKPEKHRISVSGGQHVAWRGNEVFYLAPNDMLMSVAITTRKHLQVGTPKALCRLCADSQAPPLADSIFDANAEGSQFAVVCFAPETKQRSITVLLNWRAGK